MELALSLQSYNTPTISFVDNSQTDLGFCMAVGKDQASPDPPPSNNFPFTWLTQNLLSEEGPPSPNTTVVSSETNHIHSRKKCRGSDEEEAEENYTASATKKLSLTKHLSSFLEQTFKQHTTLNPIEKVALAKRLNLRPRQVEVWFQNRRARTKLKQTEVDCEYLNKYCETLREENRRLQKELQELRALNASNPFNMQLPATTLTMCPSCQRLPTTVADAGVTIVANHS